MTQESARTVANAVLATAAFAALVVIARDRRMRRVAMRVAGTALTTTLPGYLLSAIRAAWDQSRHAA